MILGLPLDISLSLTIIVKHYDVSSFISGSLTVNQFKLNLNITEFGLSGWLKRMLKVIDGVVLNAMSHINLQAPLGALKYVSRHDVHAYSLQA